MEGFGDLPGGWEKNVVVSLFMLPSAGRTAQRNQLQEVLLVALVSMYSLGARRRCSLTALRGSLPVRVETLHS